MGEDRDNDHDARRDRAARLLVLELVDQPAGRTTSELRRTLSDLPPATVDAAIAMLLRYAVLVRRGERLIPSPALMAIDRLGLIAV
jgi:hypothetical protein